MQRIRPLVSSGAVEVSCVGDSLLHLNGALASDAIQADEREDVVAFHTAHWHPSLSGEPDSVTADAVLRILNRESAAYRCFRRGKFIGGAIATGSREDVITDARASFPKSTDIEVKRWGSAPVIVPVADPGTRRRKRSRDAPEPAWNVALDGEHVATLHTPTPADMFWVRYVCTLHKPEARESLSNADIWATSRVALESGSGAIRADGVLVASDALVEDALKLRSFYAVEPTPGLLDRMRHWWRSRLAPTSGRPGRS